MRGRMRVIKEDEEGVKEPNTVISDLLTARNVQERGVPAKSHHPPLYVADGRRWAAAIFRRRPYHACTIFCADTRSIHSRFRYINSEDD